MARATAKRAAGLALLASSLCIACGCRDDDTDRAVDRPPAQEKPQTKCETRPSPVPPTLSAVVQYMDDRELVLRDVRFRYDFGASDEDPRDRLFYDPIYVTTTRLCLRVGYGSESPILDLPAGAVESMHWRYSLETTLTDFLVAQVDVKTTEGETYKKVRPDCRPLSKKKYVSTQRVELLGKAPDGTEFKMNLWFEGVSTHPLRKRQYLERRRGTLLREIRFALP